MGKYTIEADDAIFAIMYLITVLGRYLITVLGRYLITVRELTSDNVPRTVISLTSNVYRETVSASPRQFPDKHSRIGSTSAVLGYLFSILSNRYPSTASRQYSMSDNCPRTIIKHHHVYNSPAIDITTLIIILYSMHSWTNNCSPRSVIWDIARSPSLGWLADNHPKTCNPDNVGVSPCSNIILVHCVFFILIINYPVIFARFSCIHLYIITM